jgi:hygromycin-B 7''-O-kinase
MAAFKYSERLGVLTDVQLQGALDRFGLGQLQSARPAPGGLFGQNILLETSEGSFVFRGAPHWDDHEEFDWHFQKERFFSRVVHESDSGPPVPWPYQLEEDDTLFGWPFAIMPRLPGIALWPPGRTRFSAADSREQARALGGALAALHTVRFDAPGIYDKRSDAIRLLDADYGAHVRRTLFGLMDSCDRVGALAPGDRNWIEQLVAAATPAFEMPFQPCVIHLDYHDGNVIVDHAPDRWRVTGIIDWMTAEVGHPEADLSRYLAHHYQNGPHTGEAFLRAYHEVHAPGDGFGERFRVFMTWERLLIWAYWQREDRRFGDAPFREWVRPYLGLHSYRG